MPHGSEALSGASDGAPAPPLTVLIASPLEPALVQRIAAAVPGRIRVIFEPELLPEPREPTTRGARAT